MRVTVIENKKVNNGPLLKDETPSSKETLWGLIVGGLYILGISLIPIYIIVLLIYNKNEDIAGTIAQVITAITSIAIMLFVISKSKLPAIFSHVDRDEYLYGLLGGAVMYGLELVVSMVLALIFGEEIGDNANQESIMELAKNAPVLFVIFVGFVAPIIEELIFRYYLYRPIERKLFNKKHKVLPHKKKIRNALIAGTISVLLFSGVHFLPSISAGTLLEDLKTLPLYIAPSIALIYIYYKSERIVAPVIAHMTYNIITIIVVLISNSNISEEISELVSRLW